jgi:serine/threonine-protein kinase
VHHNRALVFQKQKKWQPMMQDLNEALRAKPDFLPGLLLRSLGYMQLGNYRAALADANNIVAVSTETRMSAEGLNARAWIKATCPDASLRNGKQAMVDGKRACELTHWEAPGAIDTMAAACAEVGDFAGAAHYQEQALALLRGKSQSGHTNEVLLNHLNSFKKRQPLRDPAK